MRPLERPPFMNSSGAPFRIPRCTFLSTLSLQHSPMKLSHKKDFLKDTFNFRSHHVHFLVYRCIRARVRELSEMRKILACVSGTKRPSSGVRATSQPLDTMHSRSPKVYPIDGTPGRTQNLSLFVVTKVNRMGCKAGLVWALHM